MLKRHAPSRRTREDDGLGSLKSPPPTHDKAYLAFSGAIQTATETATSSLSSVPKNSKRTNTTTVLASTTRRRAPYRGAADRSRRSAGDAEVANAGGPGSENGDGLKSSGIVSTIEWPPSPDVRAKYAGGDLESDARITKTPQPCAGEEGVDRIKQNACVGGKKVTERRSFIQQRYDSDEVGNGREHGNSRNGRTRRIGSGHLSEGSCAAGRRAAPGGYGRKTRSSVREGDRVRRGDEKAKEKGQEGDDRERSQSNQRTDQSILSRRLPSGDNGAVFDEGTDRNRTARTATARRRNVLPTRMNACTTSGHDNDVMKSTDSSRLAAAAVETDVDAVTAGATGTVGAVNGSPRGYPRKCFSRLALRAMSAASTTSRSQPAPTPHAPRETTTAKASVPASTTPPPIASVKNSTIKQETGGPPKRPYSRPAVQTAELEEKLPPCPYPGRENVSWTCLGCDGARHHLTSRNAMEPLQRVHGFKVTRVPNDGDCFYSSIKAALEGSVALSANTGAEGLSVAQMRKWVAEEAGEEQLAFYALQATANAEERWLDFVRPRDERLPSSDDDLAEEEDEEEEEEEEEGDEEGDDNFSASSQSQTTPPNEAWQTTRNTKMGRKRPTRKCNVPEAEAEKENDLRNGHSGRFASDRDRVRDCTMSDATKATARMAMAAERSTAKASSAESAPAVPATRETGNAPDTCFERERRRRRVENSNSDNNGVMGWEMPARRASTKNDLRSTYKQESSRASDRRERLPLPGPPPVSSASIKRRRKREDSDETKRRVGPRRSCRLKGIVKVKRAAAVAAAVVGNIPERAVADDAKDKDGRGDGGAVVEEMKPGKKEAEEEEGDEGLPFVQSVDELRRFVRLEGSEVGHGRCMWADTFAHHVVSRRLKLTILFVDMEREKSAWPYRVLATNNAGGGEGYGDDERFVVLKREPNHFVLLTVVSPPSRQPPPSGASVQQKSEKQSGIEKGKLGSGSGESNGMLVAPVPNLLVVGSKKGISCFRRSELPDVVRKLWKV